MTHTSHPSPCLRLFIFRQSLIHHNFHICNKNRILPPHLNAVLYLRFSFQKFFQIRHQFLNYDRFRNMPVHSCIICILLIFLKGIGCHGNNNNIFLFLIRKLSDGLCCLISIHIWHLNVHKDQIIISGICFFQHIYTNNAILCKLDFKTSFFQNRYRYFCIQFVVFRKKNPDHIQKIFLYDQ